MWLLWAVKKPPCRAGGYHQVRSSTLNFSRSPHMQGCRRFGGCPGCRRMLCASHGWGGASAAPWSCARLQTDVWLSGRWVRCAYVMWSLWKADCLPWNSWWALLCPRTLPSGWGENIDLQAVNFPLPSAVSLSLFLWHGTDEMKQLFLQYSTLLKSLCSIRAGEVSGPLKD